MTKRRLTSTSPSARLRSCWPTQLEMQLVKVNSSSSAVYSWAGPRDLHERGGE
jgi:hypothetical protein